MEGSKMLKALSVLLIVFGVLSVGITGFELVSLIKLGLSVKTFWFPVVFALAWAVVQVLTGVVGVKFWNRPEKAMLCILCAVLAMILCVASNVCMMVYGYGSTTIISIVGGLVITVLYIMGAMHNHKLNA